MSNMMTKPDPLKDALRPTWYEIDLDAIAGNFRALRKAVGKKVEIYCCLKRNAYGCGVVPVARTLAKEGTEGLALGNIYDALAIRQAGIKLPILLYPTCLPDQAEVLQANDLMPTVSGAEDAMAWDRAASGKLKVFVKIDAGAFRAGVQPRDAAAAFSVVRSSRNLELAGAYAHFLMPKPDDAHAAWQFGRFQQGIRAAEALGIDVPLRMVAATAVVLNYPEMDLNAVDPGRMLYGVKALPNPKRDLALKPALRAFRSRVILVKRITPADAEGGAAPFELTRPMTIGLLALGWGDGFPRQVPPGASALVRGRRIPILPPAHLEHLRIDLTEVPDAEAGDEVTIFGRQGDAEITIGEVAKQWGLAPVDLHGLLKDHLPRAFFQGGRCVGVWRGAGE